MTKPQRKAVRIRHPVVDALPPAVDDVWQAKDGPGFEHLTGQEALAMPPDREEEGEAAAVLKCLCEI